MQREGEEPIECRLSFAVEIAREAGDLTLGYFRTSGLEIERKADDSPVTAADRAAEELLRKRIVERFPHDSILGEEFGSVAGTTDFQWVLDPIDGTKSFIHGVPLYTTLVAVLQGDDSCLGVIHAPATDETVYAAVGRGAWHTGGRGKPPQIARVSSVGQLRDGLLLTSEIESFATRTPRALEAYLRLQATARLARTWGDGYGYLMIATGRAEVMIDPVMNLWDVAPLKPIIEEAGGQFTDWQGRATVHSGEAIASNGLVADEVMAIVRSGP
ncbi:MAG TPA: histidinol-phosphatase [Lacipirellulaceae bacterium]|jgi:histidinol phosphatase-like enzyme (inositol monophosphatase family)